MSVLKTKTFLLRSTSSESTMVRICLALSLISLINGQQIHEDPMNMHTYDWGDWFLFIFTIVLFGGICLIIGCLWHKYLIKRSESNQSIKHLNDTMLNESSSIQMNNIKIIHKTTKTTLSTIDECEEVEQQLNCDGNHGFDTFIR